jgi:hypothetical protein
VVNRESSFLHELFQVSIAECLSQIPSNTDQDDFSLEMTPFERVLLCHDRLSFVFLHCIRSAFVFATQPKRGSKKQETVRWKKKPYETLKPFFARSKILVWNEPNAIAYEISSFWRFVECCVEPMDGWRSRNLGNYSGVSHRRLAKTDQSG